MSAHIHSHIDGRVTETIIRTKTERNYSIRASSSHVYASYRAEESGDKGNEKRRVLCLSGNCKVEVFAMQDSIILWHRLPEIALADAQAHVQEGEADLW